MYYEGIQRPGNVYVRRSSNGLYPMYSGGYYDAPPEMRMVHYYQPMPQPRMIYRHHPNQLHRMTRPYRPILCCDTCCGDVCYDTCCGDVCCDSCCGPDCCC